MAGFGTVALPAVALFACQQHQIQGEGSAVAVPAWRGERSISEATGRQTDLGEMLLKKNTDKSDTALLELRHFNILSIKSNASR